jgi:hypothetical protein
MNRNELLAVLRVGDLDELIGVREDVEVEFKRQPYQLDQEGEKFELAKDVSAFANAGGGAIVIGVQTDRSEESPTDQAVRLRLLERGLVDEERYVAVVTERIYPRVQSVRIAFHPSAVNDDRGVVVIDVPPQAEAEKLFLVQRPVGEGTTAPGWMVGIAVRSVGRVDEHRVGEIHNLINRGYTLSGQLSDLAGEVSALRDEVRAGPVGAPETPADRLEEIVETRLAELDQRLGNPSPYLYLAAAPSTPTQARTLTSRDGVRATLEHPPYTRHDGWNLVTLDRAAIVGGRRLSLANGTRKYLDLFEDGTFIVIGRVPEFLAWHRRDVPNKINALALSEFVVNFLLVYDQVLNDVDPLPEEVRLGIGLRHAHALAGPLYMSYGRHDRYDYEADLVTLQAPADSFDDKVDIPVAAEEPHVDIGAAAYALLMSLYNWFGFEDEAVPYTDEARAAIDLDQIRNA